MQYMVQQRAKRKSCLLMQIVRVAEKTKEDNWLARLHRKYLDNSDRKY